MTKNEFQQLFDKFYSPLCNYAFAILKSHDEAEDVVQGIFVDFWKKEDKDAIKVDYERYLIRAIKFKCIDIQRKEVVKRKYEAEAIHTSSTISNEEEEDNDDLKASLHIAIGELPEKTREVFLMAKMDGLSYKEISDHLNISPKTVENQMGRAFKILREKLKGKQNLLLLLFYLMGE